MDHNWDAFDNWSEDHPTLVRILLLLIVPLWLIDELLSGRRRNGYPMFYTEDIYRYSGLTELEKFRWRDEHKTRWREKRRAREIRRTREILKARWI